MTGRSKIGNIVAHFKKRFVLKEAERKGQVRRNVGLETKFCLTRRSGKAASPHDVEELWYFLGSEGWKIVMDSYLQKPVGVERLNNGKVERLASGTGYSKIEFSLAYEDNLYKVEENLLGIRSILSRFTETHDLVFLALGVQPLTPPERWMTLKKTRHLFWDKAFKSGKVHLFTITADSQVHVDVSIAESSDALNVFHGLTGAQIALTANSTVWNGKIDPHHKDVKEIFWDWWLPGDERIGVTSRKFESFEEYIHRVCSFRPVFVMRDGESIGIYNYKSFREYYESGNSACGIKIDGTEVALKPCLEDVDLHDTFYWYDARLSRYCTLENRTNSQQPPTEVMTVPALTVGLMENLGEAVDLINRYNWGELVESRMSAIRYGLDAKVGNRSIRNICESMLEVAENGLKKRGLGEEFFLVPLWERLEDGECPSDRVRRCFREGGIRCLVKEYAFC
jgi:gamma-glutamylcysteine synthetase